MVKSNKIWEYHIARRGEHLKIINLDGRLAESGFSAEEQRRLREKMIQKG